MRDKEYLPSLLSFVSGVLQTMYGVVYNTIEKEIDKSTVLLIRGFLQVVSMMSIAFVSGLSLAPQKIVNVDVNRNENGRVNPR